ncbi:MlaD family protein [Conexibacter woesei]|uniref:MlaD family protein n=1 Tax=Conexibacter woesei TaxID=191495 RepID=UPI0004220CD0|nr:MlaD family protein [Conexibacter woesei]
MSIRRRLGLSVIVIVVFALVGAALGAGGDSASGGYRVRAVFDNSSFVIKGEDVKISGVNVGTIDGLDVDSHHRAVVVLKITDPAFIPFRKDATCRVGLQSLIGEQFVECSPTQPRGGDRAPAPELPKVPKGQPGAGQHLLPVSQTSSPVGQDLLNDIMRVPEQQRLPLIINELGAGLTGNGEALAAALRRASPTLQKADKLVAILADQNRTLAKLTDDSATILAPLARHRKDLTGFIKNAGTAGAATARQGDALEQNFAKLPAFLRELGPAADRLGALADQASPTIDALDAQASSVNQTTEELGPLSTQATGALKTLGRVADQGRETLPKANRVVTQLADLGVPLQPLAQNLGALSSSFDRSGGIESLMRFIYFYTGAINGEDASGHYTRAGLSFGNCVTRTPDFDPTSNCLAKFVDTIAKPAPKETGATAASVKDAATPSANTSSSLLSYLLDGGK